MREAVLGRNAGAGSRWGQAVLVHRGVVAWIQAIGQWLAPLPVVSPAGTVPQRAHHGTGVPGFVHNELIQLMSEVVLTVAQAKVP